MNVLMIYLLVFLICYSATIEDIGDVKVLSIGLLISDCWLGISQYARVSGPSAVTGVEYT